MTVGFQPMYHKKGAQKELDCHSFSIVSCLLPEDSSEALNLSMNQPTARPYDLKAATSFVVASMVGTGVFVALGYQLNATDTVFSIMLLWVLGGIASLTGALTYCALAQMMPRSGGEYHYLSSVFGPALGYAAGILTVVVGFAAPIAISALAFGGYAGNIILIHEKILAAGLIGLVTLVHLTNVKAGGSFNWISTLVKMLLIVVFIVAGLAMSDPQSLSLMPQARDASLIMSSGFGVSLIYVTYSYTGWNAAVYMMDEVQHPERNVPRAILLGTGIVTVVYILINFVFLYSAPMTELVGQTDFAHLSAQRIFGERGALIMSGLIAFGLIANVSSMSVSGSRTLKRMAEDDRVLKVFNTTSKSGSPYLAILLIAGIALWVVFYSSLKEALESAGFVLSFFGVFSVMALFVFRSRNPDKKISFGKWFWPLVPLVYLSIKLLVIIYMIVDDPGRLKFAAGLFLTALLMYGLTNLKRA